MKRILLIMLAFFASVSVNAQIKAIDLGLSVKWADRNLGASSPEYYGDYYAWGEVNTKQNFTWGTYRYCNGSYDSLTKYNDLKRFGSIDKKKRLDMADDAAQYHLGSKWRMPTEKEITELFTKCTWTWTTWRGVNGYRVISKKNGNSIFLPAAGAWEGGLPDKSVGWNGLYWSASLDPDCTSATVIYFYDGSAHKSFTSRYYGLQIRPVTE